LILQATLPITECVTQKMGVLAQPAHPRTIKRAGGCYSCNCIGLRASRTWLISATCVVQLHQRRRNMTPPSPRYRVILCCQGRPIIPRKGASSPYRYQICAYSLVLTPFHYQNAMGESHTCQLNSWQQRTRTFPVTGHLACAVILTHRPHTVKVPIDRRKISYHMCVIGDVDAADSNI